MARQLFPQSAERYRQFPKSCENPILGRPALFTFPRQRLFSVGKRVSRNRDDSGIFLQLAWHNLVQRISCGVMIIKVKAIVLHRAEGGDAYFFNWGGVGTDMPAKFRNEFSSRMYAALFGRKNQVCATRGFFSRTRKFLRFSWCRILSAKVISRRQ